jgi:hypothetical protein
MASTNPAVAMGVRPRGDGIAEERDPINDGTTTSNANVIAVTSVTASRCRATVKKQMPMAPCTMIAQSSALGGDRLEDGRHPIA